jgi:hypothetical protein
VHRPYFVAQWHIRNYQDVVTDVAYTDPETDEPRHLSNIGALQTCLKRTALGLSWVPGQKGGPHPYLCEDDLDEFKRLLRTEAEGMNCLHTRTAISIARRLRGKRQRKAIALFESMNLRGLASQLRGEIIKDPDPTWLNHVAERLELQLKRPQTIDHFRRQCCNKRAIRIFFERFGPLMDRAPELILNCDETHVFSRNNFKVVVPEGLKPLREPAPKMPHFAAMCTISASGHKFPPTFILPDLRGLTRDLQALTPEAYFLSTESGWMNQRSFLFYCHILLYELYLYRQTLPIHLRGQRFLLLLDGHSSRWTHEAMNLLNTSRSTFWFSQPTARICFNRSTFPSRLR